MKRISIVITSLALLVASLFTMLAQAQISAGVKAGVNFSNFTTGNDFDTKSKTGLVIGGFADYQVIPKLVLQGELLFSQQGAKEDNGSYDFNYISIPVTARYNVWNGLHVVTGPQLGFLASAKINEDGKKTDIKDNVKGSDIAWVIGAGYELPNGFMADLRWVKGLSDISDNDVKIKNTTVQFTIGYRFVKRK